MNNPRVRKWRHNTDDLCLAHNIGHANEVEIRLTSDGKIVFNTDGDVEWNINTMKINGTMKISGDIQHDGSFVNNGSITSNYVTLSTHKHSAGGNPPVPGT